MQEKTIPVVTAVALKHGLKMYARSGMLLTRGMTPTKMLRLASQITGNIYKRGEYVRASDDIAAVLEEHARQA